MEPTQEASVKMLQKIELRLETIRKNGILNLGFTVDEEIFTSAENSIFYLTHLFNAIHYQQLNYKVNSFGFWPVLGLPQNSAQIIMSLTRDFIPTLTELTELRLMRMAWSGSELA